MAADEITERVRRICLALPEATERPSHGSPAFYVGRQFVMLWPEGHHKRSAPHLWAAAAPGVQEVMVGDDPERFFVPPYVGGRGWVGMLLDPEPDWDEVREVCLDGYRHVAPARLLDRLR